MIKVLSKKAELSKSDKVKVSIILGLIIGFVSMVIYNCLVVGTYSDIVV